MTSIAKIVWFICLTFVPLVGLACPDKIAILPGDWENSTTRISLRVQSQNSSGGLCVPDETIRLSFPDLNADQITGQAGKLQAWIAPPKQANRNFYYHSDSLSTDQITVIATTDSGKSWQATMALADIIAGNSETSDNDSNQTETEDDDYSVLSSQADAGSYTKSSKWQIGIGKDRLVLVGSRTTFKIEDSAGDKGGIIYYWSFGDGAAVRGAVASHTYRYPGVYQVVVTAKDSFGREAAARVKVKVIAPTVAVNFVDQTGSVRVSNQNGEEINLGNFQLIASDQPAFVFPANTIISVGQTIVIDQSISGLQFASQLSLLDPTGRLVAESNLAAKPKADLASQLVSLQARLLSAQHQLAATSFKSTGVATTKTSPALITDQEPAPTERVVTLEKTSPSPLKRLLNFFKMK